MDNRHIVDIILKARDQTGSAFASAISKTEALGALQKNLQRDFDDTARANDRFAQSLDKSERGIERNRSALERSRREYKGFSNDAVELEDNLRVAAERAAAAEKKSASERERAQRDLISAQQDYQDELKNGEEQERRFSQSGARTRALRITSLAQEKVATRELNDLARQGARERDADLARQSRAIDDYTSKIRQLRGIEAERERAMRAGRDKVTVQRIEFDKTRALAEAEALRLEMEARLRHIEANVDIQTDKAGAAEALALRGLLERDIHTEMKIDVDKTAMSRLSSIGDDVDRNRGAFQRFFSEVGEGFGNSGNRIAAFDNLLRGLFSFLVVGALQPLIVMAGAAGAALLALGSSAIFAGGALAGGLAAGAAQAIPILGVLVAYVMRLKSIMDVVQQQNLLSQQQSYKGAENNKKLADTTDAVASATDGLKGAMLNVAQAHDRVGEAQKRLVEARKEAVRQLEDLILAERRAELAAQGAVLSQEEAQQALREAISSGTGVERAQLGVQESALGLTEARTDRSRARQDAAEGQRGGIEGMPGVEAAQKQLEQAVQGVDDAKRAVDNAQRSLEKAKRGADIAGDGMTAAAGKLAFLQQQLSPAERKLADVMLRIQKLFRETAQRITEPMIGSTIRVMTRMESIIKNSGIVGALRGLAGEMGKQMERFFDSFTNDRAMSQFMGFISEARRNLKPLTDILINLIHTFLNIGQAAAPALRMILHWLEGITRQWAEWTGSREGQNAMIAFFKEGVVHLKAWMSFFGAIVRLFAAIAGAGGGAKAGLDLLTGATGGINKLTNSINEGGKAAKFFHNLWGMMKQVFSALGPVFTSIGHEIQRMFGKEGIASVKGFATFVADVLVPGIGAFIRNIGHALAILGEFLRQHPAVARMAAAFMGMSLAFGFFAKFGAIFGPIISLFRALGGLIFRLVPGLSALVGEFGAGAVAMQVFKGVLAAILSPVGLVVAAVLFLITKLELWDEIWNLLKGTILSFWEAVKPGVTDLFNTFKMLAESIGLSGSGGLMSALKPLAEFLFKVLTPALEFAAKIVGGALSLAFKGFAFTLRIITAPMRGFFKIITGGFDGLKEVVGEVIGFILDRVDDMLGVIQSILEMAGHLPFVGDKFDGMAESVGDAREDVRNLSGEMRGVGDAAAEGVDRAKREFEGLKGIKGIQGPQFGKGDLLGPKRPAKDAKSSRGPDAPTMGAEQRPEGMPLEGQLTEQGADAKITVSFGDALASINEFAGKFRAAWSRMWSGLRSRTEQAVENISRVIGNLGQSLNRLRRRTNNADFGIDFSEALKSVRRFRAAFGSHWAAMWAEVRTRSRRGREDVVDEFARMVKQLDNLSDRMFRSVDKNFQSMQEWGKRRATDMYKGISESIRQLQNVVYDGFSYISNAASESLKAFDANPVSITLQRPKGQGHAEGGFVGNMGERGRDAIHTVLGRGEAVLNWAQQKVVDPALRAVYGFGLPEMFKKVSGYHAGGQEQPGFASGGLTGPFGSGAAFNPISRFAKEKFGLTMTAGRTNHGYTTSSGNVSDHSWGGAGDFSNGVLTPQEDAFSAFWKNRMPEVVKQLIWRNRDQFNGYPISGHLDHVHLAVQRAYAFNAERMAGLIARATQGLDISDLLVAGEGAVQHVKKAMVKGTPGHLRELARKAIEKIREAANKFLDKKAGSMDGVAGPGGHYDGPLDHVFPAHGLSNAGGHAQLSADQVRELAERAGLPPEMFEAIARGESTYYPGIVSGDGGIGLWQITPWAAFPDHNSESYKYFIKLGGAAGMRNPWHNALMAKFMYEHAGSQTPNTPGFPWYGTQFLGTGGFAGKQFAMGGSVPGQEGTPVPILAHAGEWVLNKMQQSKLAQMMGFGVDRLRSALGFTGGPTSFAGGGETRAGVFGQEMVRRVPGALRDEAILGIFDKIDKYEQKIADLREKNKTEEIKKEQERHQKWMANLDNEIRAAARRYQRADTPEQQRIIRARAGDYSMPNVLPRSVAGVGREINLAQQAMRKMGHGIGIVSGAMQRYIKNLGAIVDEGGLLDQMASAIERLGSRLEERTALAMAGLRRAGGGLAGGLTRGGVRGGRVIIRRGGDNDRARATEVNILTSEIQNLDHLEDAIRHRIREARHTLKNVNDKIKKIRRGGVTKEEEKEYEQLMGSRNRLVDTIHEGNLAIAQNMIEQQDKVRARFEARTTALLRPSTRNQVWQDLMGRIASAFGNVDLQNQVARNTLTNLQEQQGILARRAKEAADRAKKDPRWQSIADQLADEWAAKTGEIAELQARILTDFISQMEEKFAIRAARLDLRGRFDDLRERVGDRRAAATDRIAVSQQRGALLGEQLRGYQFALQIATQQGNQGAMKDLTAKIEEMKLQMMENVVATQELIVASRQLSADLLRGRVESETGFIGSAIGIIQKIGEISGASQQDTLIRFYSTLAGTLSTAARDIATEISNVIADPNNPFGAFAGRAESMLGELRKAFQQGPEAYSDALVNFSDDMARLEMDMPDPMRALFRSLIDSMTQNTEATLDNNLQLQQLNGQEPQDWASTAWQQFRIAVFNGMGGLLPQYATTVPSMDAGGEILRSGALVGHIGESIVPAQIRRTSSNDNNIDLDLHFTQPMEVADPLAIAKRTAWELKTAVNE